MQKLLSTIRGIALGLLGPPPSLARLGGYQVESVGQFVASAVLGTHRGGCGGTVRLLFGMAVCSVCKRTLDIDKDVIHEH